MNFADLVKFIAVIFFTTSNAIGKAIPQKRK